MMQYNTCKEISIHAPTRGATLNMWKTLNKGIIFQSTLPREERLKYLIVNFALDYFNPRSHERSDFVAINNLLVFLYFNPRSHERSDRFALNS